MRPCPNCGRMVEPDRQVCSNCGASVPAVWPPPPAGQPDVPPLAVGKLLTGNRIGDFSVGFAISLASFAICVGVIVMPVLFLLFFKTYPALARGIGWGWLVVVLGAATVCFGPSLVQQVQQQVGH